MTDVAMQNVTSVFLETHGEDMCADLDDGGDRFLERMGAYREKYLSIKRWYAENDPNPTRSSAGIRSTAGNQEWAVS